METKNRKERQRWRFCLLVQLLALAVLLAGCGLISGTDKERSAMEFTVVEKSEIPEELQNVIREHQEEEVQIVFEDHGFLYAVRGYGKQETGGYSITVDECSEGETAVYLATTLIGPDQAETLLKDPSYPVIVVKMEKRDKEVVFE